METLRDIDVKNLNLMPWGMRYGHVMVDEQPVRMRLTKLASCPYCHEFSISSQGNFHGNPVTGKHAGNEWYNRVIGFQPSQFALTMADDPGIATIHCPRCGKMFGFEVPFVIIEA